MKYFRLAIILLIMVTGRDAFANKPINPVSANLPTPSSTAQRLYSSAKSDLLQIRVLLKNGRSQSSVGSGFIIGTSNSVITNYHVVSQIALEPEKYIAEYIDTQGNHGPVELLTVDVPHDLAVVRINHHGTGFFKAPDEFAALEQGQYLYSLGNPLDLGFAISEGTYNGIMKRGFSDQLMFTGPINAGMSGGPNITAEGVLAGVNVARRLDGELVSFLVPAKFVALLLKKVKPQEKTPADFYPLISSQLLDHQQIMIDQLLATPFTHKILGPYRAPVRESNQFRCWGNSSTINKKPYSSDQISCSMESQLYISNALRTGYISIIHTFTQTTELDKFRFSQILAAEFSNNIENNDQENFTNAKCHEEFVINDHLPMRVVVCAKAYKKFAELYDFTVLTITMDESLMNLSSSLEIDGVSYENGLIVTQQFIESITKGAAQ